MFWFYFSLRRKKKGIMGDAEESSKEVQYLRQVLWWQGCLSLYMRDRGVLKWFYSSFSALCVFILLLYCMVLLTSPGNSCTLWPVSSLFPPAQRLRRQCAAGELTPAGIKVGRRAGSLLRSHPHIGTHYVPTSWTDQQRHIYVRKLRLLLGSVVPRSQWIE